MHPKDLVPANRRKVVVCSSQMGTSLNHCLREHYWALKNGDLGSFALAEHVFSSNYQVDLSMTMVINTHTHTQTHCMESWHIQYQQAPFNRDRGYFARTLCCTTGLTVQLSSVTTIIITVIIFVLLVRCIR